jgi:integrase
MRAMEIFRLRWSDVMYDEGLLAVRAKLKGGKILRSIGDISRNQRAS